MLKNVYILHIDHPKSLEYLNDCLESCKQFPDINPIPVKGFMGEDYIDVCAKVGVKPHFFYIDKLDTPERDTINRVQSGTAGHYLIWQMIAESGEPGVVLEHDAIVKGRIDDILIEDDEIIWLGPRIQFTDDYSFPENETIDRVSVQRWEGAHAYAMTSHTAKRLLTQLEEYGMNDSGDGQLGMRNMFDINFTAIDPPPIVAVVGNRFSCNEDNGAPAFWNGPYTSKFLANMKPGANVAPVRDLVFSDKSFDQHKDALERILTRRGYCDDTEARSVLTINSREGYEALWLSNKLLKHDDSAMWIMANPNIVAHCNYNTYFSKYYYKLTMVPAGVDSTLLLTAYADSDVRYDVVYYNSAESTVADDAYNLMVSWNVLNEGGLLILDRTDADIVNNFLDIVGWNTVDHKGDFVVLCKTKT